jgi:hypothetical protein
MTVSEKAVKDATINLLKRHTLALEPAAKRADQSKLDSDRLASVALVMQALRIAIKKFCEYALPQKSKGTWIGEEVVYHPFRIVGSGMPDYAASVCVESRLIFSLIVKGGIVPEAA